MAKGLLLGYLRALPVCDEVRSVFTLSPVCARRCASWAHAKGKENAVHCRAHKKRNGAAKCYHATIIR